jgi:hypothetical protein
VVDDQQRLQTENSIPVYLGANNVNAGFFAVQASAEYFITGRKEPAQRQILAKVFGRGLMPAVCRERTAKGPRWAGCGSGR